MTMELSDEKKVSADETNVTSFSWMSELIDNDACSWGNCCKRVWVVNLICSLSIWYKWISPQLPPIQIWSSLLVLLLLLLFGM